MKTTKTQLSTTIFAALLLGATHANAQSTEEALLDQLTYCSPSFFKYVNDNSTQLSKYSVIEKNGAYAHFKVKSRQSQSADLEASDSRVIFSKPMNAYGLKIMGYTDDVTDLSAMNAGFYHNWGFLINNTPDEVTKQLKNISWMKPSDELHIANPQIIRATNKSTVWEKNNLALSGTVPSANSAEKLLMLEKTGKYLTLTCSIQGDIPAKLLKQERPDL